MKFSKFVLFMLFSWFFGSLFVYVNADVDAQDIGLSFCNTAGFIKNTNGYMVFEQNQPNIVCFSFSNPTKEALTLQYSFVEGFLDPSGAVLCKGQVGEVDNFNKHFEHSTGSVIMLTGGSAVTITGSFSPPFGMSGSFYGCLMYQLVNNIIAGNFEIVFRKATTFQIVVIGEGTIKQSLILGNYQNMLSSNKHIGYRILDDETLELLFQFTNDGNVPWNLSFSGYVRNALGFDKEFSFGQQRIMPSQTLTLSKNVGPIPFYKGFFDVQFQGKADPLFEFDTSSIDKKYLEPMLLSESGTIFFLSWIWIVLVILALLIIFKIFSRFITKKHNA